MARTPTPAHHCTSCRAPRARLSVVTGWSPSQPVRFSLRLPPPPTPIPHRALKRAAKSSYSNIRSLTAPETNRVRLQAGGVLRVWAHAHPGRRAPNLRLGEHRRGCAGPLCDYESVNAALHTRASRFEARRIFFFFFSFLRVFSPYLKTRSSKSVYNFEYLLFHGYVSGAMIYIYVL
jgi:hypothetical protein